MADTAESTPAITHLAVRALHLVAPSDYPAKEWDLVAKTGDGTLRYSETTWGSEAEAAEALTSYKPSEGYWAQETLDAAQAKDVCWVPSQRPPAHPSAAAAAQALMQTLDEGLRNTLLAALEDRKDRMRSGASIEEYQLGAGWAQEEEKRVDTLDALLRRHSEQEAAKEA